jgi:DNA-binding IclR family transcriptional regulator
MTKLPDYPVPALEKGLDILEVLGAAAVPQSLAELATQLQRSRSELFRMLNCLERRGYLSRDPASGKVSLSLKLFALAHAHSATEKLLHAARGPMQALTEKTRESCHLSVLHRGGLLVVAQEESPERVRLSIEVGGMFDASHTASGRLLLAFLGRRECDSALSSVAPDRRLDPAARKRLDRVLVGLRRTGISTADSETISGVRDVAVLVGNPDAGVTGALAVTLLTKHGQTWNEAELVKAMRATALEITQKLGLAP